MTVGGEEKANPWKSHFSSELELHAMCWFSTGSDMFLPKLQTINIIKPARAVCVIAAHLDEKLTSARTGSC